MNTCKNCRYFAPDGVNGEGECRFNPPVTHLVVVPVRTISGDAMNAQVMTVFPRVTPVKFCGKYTCGLSLSN